MTEEIVHSANTGMAWGVKASFRGYLSAMPGSHTEVDPGSGVTDSGEIFFSLADATSFDIGSSRGKIQFQGGVTFTGHSGLLQVTISNPALNIDGSGGRLVIDSPRGGEALELVAVDMGDPVIEGDVVMWPAVRTYLSASACFLFNDVYPADEPFDPITVRVRAAAATGLVSGDRGPVGE